MSLKKYSNLTLKHIISSQFISPNRDLVARVKQIRINIESKKSKNIHFFYLWFLTKQIPASRKFHLSKKKIYTNPLVQIKTRHQHLQVTFKKRKQYMILQRVIRDIISKQGPSEKKTWAFYRHCVNIYIPMAILTKKTASLQAKNSYFPVIPLQLYFRFSKTTGFEKLFLLRALKILNSDQKVRLLDAID